jgi:hypothetical protein
MEKQLQLCVGLLLLEPAKRLVLEISSKICIGVDKPPSSHNISSDKKNPQSQHTRAQPEFPPTDLTSSQPSPPAIQPAAAAAAAIIHLR